MTRNRDYWRAVAEARNCWIAGLPEMHGVEQRLARGGSTLLSGPPTADGSSGEADLLGDLYGRRLLHLGCGPGYDSISWANLGARVTAVDFVEENLRECRRLASITLGATAGLPSSAPGSATGTVGQANRGTPHLGAATLLSGQGATAGLSGSAPGKTGGRGKAKCAPEPIQTVAADVIRLPFSGETFNAVYAAGLVAWIGELTALYREVARVLLPGGRFLLVEEHPIRMTLGDDDVPDCANHPYRDQALHNHVDPTALPWPMPAGNVETDDYLWTTGTLVTRMIEAGLQIEKLLEPSWDHTPASDAASTTSALPTCLAVLARKPPSDA